MTNLPLLPLQKAPRDLLARIRLIASDIDGTMTRDAKLPPEILSAFLALEGVGVEVLPITGRPAGEALSLARYLPAVRRAVAENGAVYVVPEEPVHFLHKAPDRARLMAVAESLSPENPLTLAPDAFCRLGDIAYLREGRDEEELSTLRLRAEEAGVFLIWSSVHIHLSEYPPDKGAAALLVAKKLGYLPEEIATIGDAPNDAGLFAPGRFGLTVGTEDVKTQRSVLEHLPAYLVKHAADGWLELADTIIRAKQTKE